MLKRFFLHLLVPPVLGSLLFSSPVLMSISADDKMQSFVNIMKDAVVFLYSFGILIMYAFTFCAIPALLHWLTSEALWRWSRIPRSTLFIYSTLVGAVSGVAILLATMNNAEPSLEPLFVWIGATCGFVTALSSWVPLPSRETTPARLAMREDS